MKILIYGEQEECSRIQENLLSHPQMQQLAPEFRCRSQFDEFYIQLVDYAPELIIVAADGADGMEGVRRSRRVLPDTPIFWFSDDLYFGSEAYRLDCTYFSVKPVCPAKYDQVLSRLLLSGGM